MPPPPTAKECTLTFECVCVYVGGKCVWGIGGVWGERGIFDSPPYSGWGFPSSAERLSLRLSSSWPWQPWEKVGEGSPKSAWDVDSEITDAHSQLNLHLICISLCRRFACCSFKGKSMGPLACLTFLSFLGGTTIWLHPYFCSSGNHWLGELLVKFYAVRLKRLVGLWSSTHPSFMVKSLALVWPLLPLGYWDLSVK